ncbi:hypothetical protein [Streptomonospora litoralis]|uniref:Helix-turn-helix domain-containing protein n=1 Tax=Streptomonospora litoralis TaxID=2498135 RepID=A0A4P6PYY9_9ACTN|nr:hypothetical protein [Streptomonospora litoralis]QBI53468.1 hypothetical protein EKD16_08370 [Streptomonospora litoralis]
MPTSPARAAGPADDRRATYAELQAWGYSQTQAAARIGVCVRTIQRYARHLRQHTTTPEETPRAH